MRRVIFVTGDADIAYALLDALRRDHSDIDVITITVVTEDWVYVSGCEPASVAKAVQGAEFVFIGENLPVSSERCLDDLRKCGLSRDARIIGTSRENQPYVEGQMLLSRVIGSPTDFRALLNM